MTVMNRSKRVRLPLPPLSTPKLTKPANHDIAALAHARKQTAELRAMLDELLLSVQGESIYLCDEVWAVADRIAAQLKEQDDK